MKQDSQKNLSVWSYICNIMSEKLVKRRIPLSSSQALEFAVDTMTVLGSITGKGLEFCWRAVPNWLAIVVSRRSVNFARASPENDLVTSLQEWKPSSHVWSKLESPSSPHFLNQAPPRVQQLSWPDFVLVPHLGHTGTGLVDVVMGTTAPSVLVCGHRAMTQRRVQCTFNYG